MWGFSIDARDDRSAFHSWPDSWFASYVPSISLISEIIVCLRGNNTVMNITFSSLIMDSLFNGVALRA